MAPDEPYVGDVLNLRDNTAPAAKWHGLPEGASVMRDGSIVQWSSPAPPANGAMVVHDIP
jgi:hypothetical protein